MHSISRMECWLVCLCKEVRGTMEKAMQYLDLIRKDPFLHAMLASYDNAAAAQVQDCVLDYGCGYGWGSYILSDSFRHVTGYDPDAERISFARRHFARKNIAFTQDGGLLAGRRYDVICLFMFLPYVEDSGELLARLGMCLKPEGFIWISYKSADTALLTVIKSWSQQRGFVLACSSSRRLSDREEVVEQCYGRHRDEGWTYAL